MELIEHGKENRFYRLWKYGNSHDTGILESGKCPCTGDDDFLRANRCSSLYNDIFALRGWKTEEINGIEFELNSILVEKWKGKAYRLVIQRQKRMDGVLDLWEGEYTYRCILTNDYESSTREIVEFYNLRGGKERIFDDMNNGFGWDRLPKSFMAENTVFLLLTALIRNFYKAIIHRLDVKRFGLNATSLWIMAL